MFCPKCGFKQQDDAQFCMSCGVSISNLPQTSQQQPFQQSFQQDYQQNYQMQVQPGNGAANTSLICGIVGIFILGLILGIIAIVQGNSAKKQGYVGSKATIGIVLGILDIVFSVLWLLFIIVTIAALSTYQY